MLIWTLCFGLLVTGDVPKVQNPQSVAVDKPMTLSFEEDLRIGPTSDDGHLFWLGTRVMVDVDSRGRIYVLDPGNQRVVVFAPDGTYLHDVGRAGAGPGEFQALTNFAVLNDDRVLTFESRMGQAVLSWFQPDGSFEKRTEPTARGKALQSAIPSPQGDKLAVMFISVENGGAAMIGGTALVTPELGLVDLLMEKPLDPFSPTEAQTRAWWSQYLAGWLGVAAKQSVVAFDRNGSIYTAYIDQYRITRHNQDYKANLVIEKQYAVRFRPEEEQTQLVAPMREEVLAATDPFFHRLLDEQTMAKAVEEADFPQRKPPIYGLVPMGDKGLMVIHDYDLSTGAAQGDLFNQAGQFVGTTQLPPVDVHLFGAFLGRFVKMSVRDDHAYAIHTDEEGEQWMTRYKLIWE